MKFMRNDDGTCDVMGIDIALPIPFRKVFNLWSERSQGTPPVVTQAEEGSVESSLANTHSGETGIPTTPGDEAVYAEERGDAHNVEDTHPDSEEDRAGSTEPSHSGTDAPLAITPTHTAPTRHSTRIRQAPDYYGWKHCSRREECSGAAKTNRQ